MWSAPNARASSSRSASWSITITVPAPISRATATAWMPSPPAPWITTLSPNARPARVRPKSTWERAQFTGETSASGRSSGTRKMKPPGRT